MQYIFNKQKHAAISLIMANYIWLNLRVPLALTTVSRECVSLFHHSVLIRLDFFLCGDALHKLGNMRAK